MVKKINSQAPADVTDVEDKTVPAVGLAAGLDALIDEAGEREDKEQEQQHAGEQKQEKQELDTLKADMLDALEFIATPAQKLCWWLTPEQFEQLWGKSTQKAMADPLAKIMRRNGWDVKGIASEYGPYIALGIAVVPPAMATLKVYKEAKAWKDANKAEVPGGDAQAG